MRAISIPDAIHICPGCSDLCVGAEFCSRCSQLDLELEAKRHAQRGDELFRSLPRETGLMPGDEDGVWKFYGALVVLVFALMVYGGGWALWYFHARIF